MIEILMLILAICLDLGQIIADLFTPSLSILFTIFGFITIGGWLFLKSGTLPPKKGGKTFFRKIAQLIGGEIIPLLNCILPMWTITVIGEIREK